MNKLKLGIAVTGSFCTLKKTLEICSRLKESYDLYPILSYSVRDMDTRFFGAADFKKQLIDLCEKDVIDTITAAEVLGPKPILDALAILPCTGNTLAKMALGITDTPVTMAVKAHTRNLKPAIICLSTNDGLAASLQNLAALYNKKHFYIAPFAQDDCVKKPNSLVVKFDLIDDAIKCALDGKQIQPLLL